MRGPGFRMIWLRLWRRTTCLKDRQTDSAFYYKKGRGLESKHNFILGYRENRGAQLNEEKLQELRGRLREIAEDISGLKVKVLRMKDESS
jgi:hypothetical protein